MSEDVEEASKQQITTRSGRSFGVGPVGDSGDLLAAAGTRPSSTAHSASSPLVESEETQIALTATTTTESSASTVATQMDSPVSSPSSSSAAEGSESSTGDGRHYELPAGFYSAPGQSEFDNTMGNDTLKASGLSEHDDDSRDTVAQCVSTPSPGPSWENTESQSWPIAF